MNRKQTMVKHALKKAAVVSGFFFLSAFLLSGRGTLMTVQAQEENAEAVQPENLTAEALPETGPEGAVQVPEAGAAEELSAQADGAAEETQAQIESTAEETQVQADGVGDEPQAQDEKIVDPNTITMVGDSVMLGGSPAIQNVLPGCVIDAKVGRQMIQAYSVMDSLEQQNALRQTVIIGLGTNGPFSVAKGQELIDRLGSGRTIYWVTVYGRELAWQEESNATIRTLAENNENVHIIDWSQAVSGHPEWICSDGIHLSAEGRAAYAEVVFGGL